MLSLLFQEPLLFLVWIFAILIALSTHEFSHALVGTWLGDTTAKRMGRLTLNPVAHVDPIGLIALIAIGFGWGKPVPFNPYNLKNQKWGPVAVALAGPGMNLLVAAGLGLLLRAIGPALGPTNLLTQFLFLSIFLNVALLLFNLIPVPPLDGSKLLLALVSDERHERVRIFLETRGPLILLGLIIADLLFGISVFGWLFNAVISVTTWIVGFGI